MFSLKSVKAKIVGGFSLVILILVCATGLYQFAHKLTMEGFHIILNGPVKGVFTVDEANISILKNRIYLQAFLLKKDRESFSALRNEINTFQGLIDSSHKSAQLAGRDDLEGAFQNINNIIGKFNQSYEKMSGQLETSGYQLTDDSAQSMIRELLGPISQLQEILAVFRGEALKDNDKFAAMVTAKADKLNTIAIIVAVFACILGITISILITNNIGNPISKAISFAEKISDGDFREKLDIQRNDEIGQLVHALNTMRDNLQDMIVSLKQSSADLTGSAGDLLTISGLMASDSEKNAFRSNSVSAATEEMSSTLASVAAAMEQSATNTGMVAAASEEMNATIDEITKNAFQARETTQSAVKQSASALEQMTILGKVAETIGQVTETIRDISDQTSLLALNATIEAARAGEAGKGFAVVANEIKELANQTAEATQNIKEQIDNIQVTSSLSIDEITKSNGIIDQVNDIVGVIASAVEEQSVTTREISSNINQASQGIQDVNVNISESSKISEDISKNIGEVKTSAENMESRSHEVKTSSESLSTMATNLNGIVERFKI